MLKIIIPKTKKDIEAAKQLSRQYLQWLTQVGSVTTCYLNEQNAYNIVEKLPFQHQKPEGCLLLATWKDEAAGTIAVTKIDDSACEMKRLYVNPTFRQLKIGEKLIEKAILQAHKLSYKTMRLDTFPKTMNSAYKLYQQFGFQDIEKYNSNTMDGVVFMEKQI